MSERSSHPSREQVEHLVEYMEANPFLSRGFSRVPSSRDMARKKWEKLSIQLNSKGGSYKSWKQWAKYWADKKSSLKKKLALSSADCCKTTDGVEEELELTDVEKRIVTLLQDKSSTVQCESGQQMHCPHHRRRPRPRLPQPRSPSPTPSPPSQRRSQLLDISERFIRAEEQRLELDRRSVELLESLSTIITKQMDRDAERDQAVAQGLRSIGDGLTSVGEGLKMLAELNRNK